MINAFKHGLSEGEKVVIGDMTVGELADKLRCPANSLIVFLLQKGVFANKNQVLKKEKIVELLTELDVEFVEEKTTSDSNVEQVIEAKSSSGTEQRLPVVAVVGHVDHGKTSLLDFVQKTKVASREKGGITQRIAAYEVETQYGNLVFLDTPGHEAFSLMRERGVLVADLVVLVVALDDGVKPQTIESIKKIQELGTTTVVALNKVDKVKADRLDIVKRQLSDHNILPDEWGGDTPFVAISAKTGQGVEELLEVVRLQADILDLKTSTKEPAQGFVLESMIEKGRGAVATVLLHKGKICQSDHFICGQSYGKVSSLENYEGKQIKCAGPSIPVKISGFSSLPSAGNMFEFATAAQVKKHKQSASKQTSFRRQITESVNSAESINVILKAGTLLSQEALLSSLKKLNKKHNEKIKIIDAGVGDINEGNLELALTTDSIVYGLGVKAHKSAMSNLKKPVEVKNFDIIYKLLEDIEQLLEDKKIKEVVEKQLGTARVKAIFRIKTIGVIAGAAVESGMMQQGAKARVYRNGKVVGSGTIKTLQKERTTVSSITENNDCAFSLDNFSDWKIGDEVHCFIES